MIRREIAKDIIRYSIWEDFVRRDVFRRDTVRRDTNRTKIVLVLLTEGDMVRRRRGCKNGRIKVRSREGWEGFAQMFNIAAGFSPGRKEIFKFKGKMKFYSNMWGGYLEIFPNHLINVMT